LQVPTQVLTNLAALLSEPKEQQRQQLADQLRQAAGQQ
jgi:hypothetical protein